MKRGTAGSAPWHALFWMLALPALAWAQSPHQHGAGRLDVAVDAGEIYAQLTLTAADVFGTEHAPRDAAGRQAIAEMAKVLAAGDGLFTPSAAAQCRLTTSEVRLPWTDVVADEHEHEHSHATQAHADVSAEYRFDCAEPKRLRQVDIHLFEHLPRLQRLRAQFITTHRQGVVALTPEYHRLDL